VTDRGFPQALEDLRAAVKAARGIQRAYAGGDIVASPYQAFVALLIFSEGWIERAAERLKGEVPPYPPFPPDEAPTKYASVEERIAGAKRSVQGSLSFSRPCSYTLEDRTRRLKITLTIEDAIEDR
jgi:hypothetical protein